MLAGNGVQGYRDGEAGAAQFMNPSDVAISRDGSVRVLHECSFETSLTTLGIQGGMLIDGGTRKPFPVSNNAVRWKCVQAV